MGHRSAWFTIGPRGKRMTVGGLGTGLFYTTKIPPATPPHAGHQTAFAVVVILALLFVAALI